MMNISDEAIASEKNLELEVIRLHKDLLMGAKQLLEVYKENKAGLGWHDAIIYQLLEELTEASGDTSKVAVLKKVLNFSVTNRQAHKDNPNYRRR